MSAIKDLYIYVKELVEAIPEIEFFDWWNDNVITDGQNTPYPRPAVFFELRSVSWNYATKGTVKNQSTANPERTGDAEFALHIIYDKKDSSGQDVSELVHLDYVEAVYLAVNFSPSKPFIEGQIQLLRDETVPTHTVLRDWPQVYSVRLYECPTVDPNITEVTPWAPILDYTPQLPPYMQPPSGITIKLRR